jgi:hypothetical protein
LIRACCTLERVMRAIKPGKCMLSIFNRSLIHSLRSQRRRDIGGPCSSAKLGIIDPE